ncbi:LOW QUALITY PROTEIN: hypothetical protein V2J09_009529 [Rumex salicifolius]
MSPEILVIILVYPFFSRKSLKTLSFVGRVTLTKSILTYFPVYSMNSLCLHFVRSTSKSVKIYMGRLFGKKEDPFCLLEGHLQTETRRGTWHTIH